MTAALNGAVGSATVTAIPRNEYLAVGTLEGLLALAPPADGVATLAQRTHVFFWLDWIGFLFLFFAAAADFARQCAQLRKAFAAKPGRNCCNPIPSEQNFNYNFFLNV